MCYQHAGGGATHLNHCLDNVTLPYALDLANLGFVQAIKRNAALAKGVNVYAGYVTNQGVAEAHGLEYRLLEELI